MKKTALVVMGVYAAFTLSISQLSAHEEGHPEKPKAAQEGAQVHEHSDSKPKADDHGHSHSTKKSEGSSHGHDHAAPKVPEKIEDVWKEITKQQKGLVDTVTQKKLSSAHDYAFAIRSLVNSLPSKVAEEVKTAAEEGAKGVAKIVSDIDKSSSAGAQKATEDNVRKLTGAITGLQTKLKGKEVQK